MSSLTKRGGMLYAKIKDVNGVWRQVTTGCRADEREKAEKWVAEREREVARELRRRAGTPELVDLVLSQWVERWVAVRRERGVDSNNDYGRLRDHVLPRIGDKLVREVTTADLVDLFHTIRTTPIKTPRGLEPPSPRTVHNIYSAVRACFRGAQMKGIVKQSPCILTDTELGEKLDATPGWRDAAVFDRDEAQTLISSSKIPWDRRVAYAIELLGALRPGENAAIRWRHLDTTLKPLAGLKVGEALDSKHGVVKRTKTKTEKWIPVHPTLAAILAEWKLSGWAAMVGRNPEPDDLIVPLPPADAAARTKRRDAEPFRTSYYAGRRWRDDDLPALGWRDRRHYDMRATFVTLALDDGADEDVIERRVTHTKKSRSAFDMYNRGKQWAIVCAEVSKLRLARASDDEQLVESAAALGAVMVQSEISSAMSASSWLRRRVSNVGLVVVDGGRCESSRDDGHGDPAPAITGLHQTAPSQGADVPKSACDLGIALMLAVAVSPDE